MRRRVNSDANMPLFDHIKDLRKVLLITVYAVVIAALAGWYFSDQAFAYLAKPVTALGQDMFITTTPLEPTLVKLKMSLIIGVLLASPIIIWQLWSFILPALKQKERKLLYLIVPSSLIMLFAGMAFCFFVVLPVGIKFLLFSGNTALKTTALVTMSSFLSFIMTFLITFGLVFQLPIVLLILVRVGIVTPKALAHKRRWALFIIVILAAVVSPTPDLLSQAMMAGPMYLLYEVSIWLGYLMARRRAKALAAE